MQCMSVVCHTDLCLCFWYLSPLPPRPLCMPVVNSLWKLIAEKEFCKLGFSAFHDECVTLDSGLPSKYQRCRRYGLGLGLRALYRHMLYVSSSLTDTSSPSSSLHASDLHAQYPPLYFSVHLPTIPLFLHPDLDQAWIPFSRVGSPCSSSIVFCLASRFACALASRARSLHLA